MDYHSLPRKQLQALCKKHEIPANLTNAQMADALAALLNVEAAKGVKKQSATGKDEKGKPVLTEISNVPKVCTRAKKVGKAIEEEKLEEQPQSTDSEGDGGVKTGKTKTRGPTKAGLKTGKGDEVVEEVVKTRRGICREKTSAVSVPEVNVDVVEQKLGNNNKKKTVLVNEVVKEKVEEPVELDQGLQVDLALQNGRRNARNPRKKAEVGKQSELNVGGSTEENTEATPPCKKTARTRAGKVTHEVGSRSVAAHKSSVKVSDEDEENMTKTTELSSDKGTRKPHKEGKSPIIIDLVDDSDEEEEGSEEKEGDAVDASVHNTLVIPAQKATAAEHRKDGDKKMPAQRTLRGRQVNGSVVESNAKLSESSKHMVTRTAQKGGKKELAVKACDEEGDSIEGDASIETTVKLSQSPKHVAARRGRRGVQKEMAVVNAFSNRKVNVVDSSVEAPTGGASLEVTTKLSQSSKQIVTRRSQKVGQKEAVVSSSAEDDEVNVVDVSVEAPSDGASLEATTNLSREVTTNLSQSPKQIVTRRSQKVGQKKEAAVSASAEEDKVNVLDVSLEARTDPVDASLEATANFSESPKQVITRRSRKAGQKEEVAISTKEDKVNVDDISAETTSHPVEASLEATTNLSQSPKQIVTRRGRKAEQTKEVAVSAGAEKDKVSEVDVSVEATAYPSYSSKQVVTRRGRKGRQKDDEDKNEAANPAQSPRQVVTCRGKKDRQKELVIDATAVEDQASAVDVSIEATVNYSGSLKREVTCRGRKGGQKDESAVTKNEAAITEAITANPLQSPKQVVTRRGRKGQGGTEEDKVKATINCTELPKQVLAKGRQKAELVVTKMVEEDKSKVVDVPVEEDAKDCNEDHQQSSFEAVKPDGLENMAYRKNTQRKIHGPKIETRRTCRKQGPPENEHHKKANIVKASEEKQRQSSFDTDVKETIPTQDLQRKVRVSKPRKNYGKQDGAEIEYPLQEKPNLKESHQNDMSSGRTAIRRDLKAVRVGIYEEADGGEALVNNETTEEVGSGERNIHKDLKPRGKSMKKPSVRGSQSTINGAEQKVVAEKEDGRYMRDEGADTATSKQQVSAPMDGETNFKESAVEIKGTEIHDEEQQIIKLVTRTDTAVVNDAIHMDVRRNMEDEGGADAATSEQLGLVPMDDEANFKESTVEIEDMKIHDEEQQIIKPVAPTDDEANFQESAVEIEDMKIHDEEQQIIESAAPTDDESNFKESAVEIEEIQIHDEEQQIIKLVAPTDECTHESQLGDPNYLEKDSETELVEGYKLKPVDNGNFLKQCQSVIEVSSTIIQVEDMLDNSSLTEQTKNEETQPFEILSHVKCSDNEKKSSIGIEEESQVKERLEILPAQSGLGALEVHDLEAHLHAADIADLNVENVEVQESEFLVHVECDIHEHMKQKNPVDVSHRGLLIEQSFEVLQADSQFVYNSEVQDKRLPGLVDEMIEGDQFKQKSENVHISSSCTAETDKIIQSKDSVAGESLTDTDVDSQDDSLSECYDPLEEDLKAANGTNEEQFSESGSDQEYEGRGIFPDASHLKEEDNEDTDDEDESQDLDIAEETADDEKIRDSIADTDEEDESHDMYIAEEREESSFKYTDDEDESHDLDIAEETADDEKIQDSLADTDDEDESLDMDTAEETADEEKTQDSIADTDDEDESLDMDIAEETADEEKIKDSIAGNWNEDDQSELHEKQALEILPQQASYSEARDGDECTIQCNSVICVQKNPISVVNDDSVVENEQQIEKVSTSETHDAEQTISTQDGEECTIQYISPICVQENPISLVNDEAHGYGLKDPETIEGSHDSVLEKEEQIEKVYMSETHDAEETISAQDGEECTMQYISAICVQENPISLVNDEAYEDGLKDSETIEGSHDSIVEKEDQIEKVSMGETHDTEETTSAQDGEECTIQYVSAICVQENPISLVDEAHEYGLKDSETIEGSQEKEEQIEKASMSETHDAQETISHKNYNGDQYDGSPMLSDAVCLKVEDHQFVHASYDEAQDANENIRVSDVGLQHHNSAIKAEAHEDKFYYSNIDKQFYGSKVDTVYSMSELMPSLSQHASDSADYEIDVIHIQTQTEGDTSKDQFSCVFNYKEAETDTAEEIVDSLISLGMDESVLEREADTAEEIVHTSINFEDSNDVLHCSGMTDFVLETVVNTASINFEDSSNVFLHSGMDDSVLEKLPEILTEEACKQEVSQLDTPLKTSEVTEGYNMSPCLTTLFGLDYSTASKQPELRHCDVEEKIPVSDIDLQINCSGMTDFVLETEVNTASINFEDSSNVFLHSGMDDSVLEKLPEILTEEACKQEVSQLDTPLKTSEVTEGYNMSPCLTTLFGLDYSTASKQPELRHCDVEEKIPVSDIDLQINSSLLSDTDDEDESHDLDIAEETVDEEKIAVSIGGMQKGNLLVKDQADENQSVDSVSSLQNDNVLFEDEVNDQASNEFAEYEECATMNLQNDSLLVDKCCQAQSIDFSSNQGFQSLKLNLDAGNWNEDDQFEILHENQVLEIPAQQTSYSELQDGEECRKEYISEHGLNDSKTIEKYQDSVVEKEEYQDSVGEEYQDSVVEKEEQIEQFSNNETQDAQETVSPKNYNDDQNDLHFVVSYDEVQKAMKDEAHEYKSYYSDNSKEFYGLDELNGSTPQKEEDDRQQICKNEVHEGESMDCSSTPELKNKLKFDADNLNGAHLVELLPKTLSLENLSQLASYSEAQEPGECSNEDILVLNDVQESHITLVNGEAQEDKLSDSKTSERFHDTVYEKEEQYECVPIVAEIQNTEEIISPMIYNGKQNDGSPELLDAVWLKVENSQEVEEADEDVQASEFCLQSCNSVMKDEVHLDNFFSDNSEEFYGVNQYVSTPQKEADGVEQISKNETGDVQIPLTEGDQVEYGSYSVAVGKNEAEDRACHVESCQESISIVVGITDGSTIKKQSFDMDNNGEHEGSVDSPDKIEGKEQSIQNEAEEPRKCQNGENILVKVDTVASNQEPSDLDTPLKMSKLTEGLDISPCLNSLFGLYDSVPEKSPQILTKEACKQELQFDASLKISEVTEGYTISPCLSSLFGLDSSTPFRRPELGNSYNVSPCFGMNDSLLEQNKDVCQSDLACNQQYRDVTSSSFEDALQKTLVAEHLIPEAPLGDHVSLTEKDARVFEGTEQSKSIPLEEKPVESGVAEGATILADMNVPSKGDSKSTKLIDRILTLSNRLQTLHLDLQGQLPESLYATPSRKQMNSKGIGSAEKTRDPTSVYRPRQSIESDEAMHSFTKESPTQNETEAKGSEKDLSSNALDQRVESLDTPLKMLEHTEGHDISPCLYTLFGPEYNTQLKKPELTENNVMSPCLQILFAEQNRDVAGTPFEDALQKPLVTEPRSPKVSLGYHASLMDKDVRVFEEAEQSKLMQLDLQGHLPELCYVTPSRKQMNLQSIVSEKKTRDPMSIYRPRQSTESDKALRSSMKENPSDLAQLSLRKLRNLYKENDTQANDSEKVMNKRPALHNLSSNALVESTDTPLKAFKHTEGHDISPRLYTSLKKPDLKENNDMSPCLQILFEDTMDTMDKDVNIFEGTEQSKCAKLDLQGQLPELCYITPSRKQMNSKGIGSAKKTRDPMSVNRPRPSIESDKAMHSSMKENPTDLAQLSLRQLRNLYKEKETKTKTKDSEKVVSKRSALQNLSSNALEQRVESVGYSPRPFPSERRLQILEEDCS